MLAVPHGKHGLHGNDAAEERARLAQPTAAQEKTLVRVSSMPQA